MPKPFPKEFRADVIAVARQGDQSIAQVARSFGVSESCLARWLKIADRDEGRARACLGCHARSHRTIDARTTLPR